MFFCLFNSYVIQKIIESKEPILRKLNYRGRNRKMHEQTDQAKIMGHSSRVPGPIRLSLMIIQKQNSELLKNACF